MITVCFYGDLQQFGRRYKLYAQTPAEAIYALCTQIKGLRKHIEKGAYQVRFNRHDISEDEAEDVMRKPGSGILHIVPRVAGSGRFGQIIVGIVMIVIAYYMPATAPALASMQSAMYAVGFSMMLGGVIQLLTKPPTLNPTEAAKSSRNSSFSNLSNTAAQGQPVPLAYGLCYCGSRVVSQSVITVSVDTFKGETHPSRLFSSAISRFIAKTHQNANTENQQTPVVTEPSARDYTLSLKKTFVRGTAAIAPNGKPYNTDFNNDSVSARNYIAEYEVR